MKLLLRRSEKTAGMLGNKIVFCLDARAELTPAEAANVKKYNLGSANVYNSSSAQKHIEAGTNALMGRTMGGLLRGAASMAMAKLSLTISIDSLTRGQHIECKDLEETLGAEEAIMQACQNLKGYLQTAATFNGQEQVIDFDQLEAA